MTLRFAHTEEGFVQKAEKLPDVTCARLQNGTLALYLDRRQPDFDELFRWTESLGTSVLDMNVKETTLGDVFVYLTGKGMNQDV